MEKTKTINPEVIADTAKYSCIIPLLAFLFLGFNWKERLKWVCAILIVVNFSFDFIDAYFSKRPIASGSVVAFEQLQNQHRLTLQLKEGRIFERQFFRARNYTGIIASVISSSNEKAPHDRVVIEIKGNLESISAGTTFRTYSTLRIVNVFLLIELTLIFLIFHIIFRGRKLLVQLTVAAIILSFTLWIYRNLALGQIHTYGGLYNAGTTILIIIFALIFFYDQLKNTENLFVYSTSAFWMVVAILLFKAGTFFLFLYANSLDQSDLLNFYLFDSFFYILQNLLFAAAFTVKPKTKLRNID